MEVAVIETGQRREGSLEQTLEPIEHESQGDFRRAGRGMNIQVNEEIHTVSTQALETYSEFSGRTPGQLTEDDLRLLQVDLDLNLYRSGKAKEKSILEFSVDDYDRVTELALRDPSLFPLEPATTFTSIVRGNQAYFPVNNFIYRIGYRVLQSFCRFSGINLNELEEVDLRLLQQEVAYNLRGDTRRTFDISFQGERAIKGVKRRYPFREHLEIKVYGTTYRFTNYALSDYFWRFDLDPEPLTKEHEEHLHQGLLAELGKDPERDMIMKLHGTEVVRILISNEFKKTR